ncbi:MAG: alpha/beta hydrolase [Deltaproteobacteria bacterium]|nr:alpha/beta hydrolase [Deltaproteobacteria bacterium]
MPEIFVRDEVVYFQDSMKASSHVILFLHGAGGSHHTFRDQWARLKGTARLVIPDLPGHARSGGTPFETIPAAAGWVADFVKELGLRKFILAGHSMGGAIAIQSALNEIPGIEALVLIASGAKMKVAPEIVEGIEKRFREFAPELVDKMLSSETSSDLREDVLQDVLSTRPATYLADFRACTGFDVMSRIGVIRIPTLVVNGSDDMLTPLKYGEYLAMNIPGAVLKILHGTGHLPILERPNELVAVITAFIHSLDG